MAAQRKVALTVAIVLLAMLVADQMMILAYDQARSRTPTSLFILDESLWAGLLIGTLASQLVLAVVYAALGDGSSPRRVLYTTFVLAVFANILVVTNVWWFSMRWDVAVGGFLIPMLFFFSLQIPLWVVRIILGWTIKSPWSESESRRMRFSLAHLLGWSAFLAVPLCILQGISSSDRSNDIIEFLLMLSVWTVVGCALIMWLLRITFSADKRQWTAGLPVLAAVGTQVATSYLWLGRIETQTVIMFVAANFLGALYLLTCLRLAHRMGFRLVTSAT